MQPAKPSFLEYFEQKEKEANSQDGGERGENNADNRKAPAETDLEVVSETPWGVSLLCWKDSHSVRASHHTTAPCVSRAGSVHTNRNNECLASVQLHTERFNSRL